MKHVSILRRAVALLLLLTVFAACKQQDADEFVPVEDSGIQLASITLSANALTLTGSRGKTKTTLTATAAPSYAADTTIVWASSDENVVSLTVDEEDSGSVTVVLQGSGAATITAASVSGFVKASCAVTCELETTAPLPVQNVTTVANGNNVYLQWTDPRDYDGDLDYIQIVASSGESATVPAGVQYGWVQGLSPATEYTFTLTAYDESGNASDSVTTAAVTTADAVDTTAPVAATALTVTENGGETIAFSWTVASNAVYQKLVMVATDGGVLPESALYADGSAVLGEASDDAAVFLLKDAITNGLTIDGVSAGAHYMVQLYSLNVDLVASDVAEYNLFTAPVVTDLQVSAAGSCKLAVTWTDFANASYSYKVVLNGETVTVASGVQKATFSGLTPNSKYTAVISTMSGSEELATLRASGTAYRIWHLLSGYSSGRYLGRATADSYTVGAIQSGVGGDEYWIVHEALSGNTEYFSLEACGSDFVPSGYYMYLDTTGRAQDTGTNLWTSSVSYTNKLQVAKLSEELITSDKKDASFKKAASTVKTGDGWYRFYDENLGMYLCHASLAFGGVAASTTEDTAGCAAIYIEEVE